VLHTFEITSADLIDCSCLADVAQVAEGAIVHDVMTMLQEREAAAAAAEAEAAALAQQERGVFEEPSQASLTVSVVSADAAGGLDAGPSTVSKGGAASKGGASKGGASKGGASKGAKEEPSLAAGSIDADSMASVVVAAPWPLTYAPLPQDLARALQALWQVPHPPPHHHHHSFPPPILDHNHHIQPLCVLCVVQASEDHSFTVGRSFFNALRDGRYQMTQRRRGLHDGVSSLLIRLDTRQELFDDFAAGFNAVEVRTNDWT
jgi:hypothetical protein